MRDSVVISAVGKLDCFSPLYVARTLCCCWVYLESSNYSLTVMVLIES